MGAAESSLAPAIQDLQEHCGLVEASLQADHRKRERLVKSLQAAPPLKAGFIAETLVDHEDRIAREREHLEQSRQLLLNLKTHEHNMQYTKRVGRALDVLESSAMRDPDAMLKAFAKRAEEIQGTYAKISAHVAAPHGADRQRRVNELLGLQQASAIPLPPTAVPAAAGGGEQEKDEGDPHADIRRRIKALSS